MANLIVSGVCNQNCAYCFTGDRFRRGPAPRAAEATSFLSLDAFQVRLDFLTRSGLDEVRLLGGEPTLHPNFADLVARAVRSGKSIVVFTNGLMPPAALSCLEALPADRCRVIVNVNAPAHGAGDARFLLQEEVLSRLGARSCIGLNIHRTDFSPDFLLRLIVDTGCEPLIRLGLAQPSLSGANRHIQPGQYRAVATRLVPFIKRADGAGVRTGFDCGFVPCMFSPAELADLAAAGVDRGWHCSAILDVDLDDRVLYCFPLAALAALPLTSTVDAATLHTRFEKMMQPYRRAGVYRECSTCALRAAGECTGGCLAVTIRRFRHSPFRVEVPRPATVQAATQAASRTPVPRPPFGQLGAHPSGARGAIR
ncbi:MAG TPA: radical SAM protein [Anaerolineae bacterium]|nr:radical SAM protein [Anaerolineae bacterium]